MKALITGGSGFIGSNLVEYLISNGYEVVNLSKHTYAMNPRTLEHLNENKKYKFVAADINDAAVILKLFQEEEFDVIFHLAAETHVDRSFIYPRDFLISNVVGTFNLLDVIRHLKKQPKFIYMSTDEVFGDIKEPLKSKENDHFHPGNPYSASKVGAEAFVTAYQNCFNLKTIIARSMNNYGPRQHPEKLFGKIMTRNILGIPYTLYEGDAVRGWIYVKDTCSALKFISENGIAGEAYNIPAHDYLSVKQVNDIIIKEFENPSFKGFEGRRFKDDSRYCLDGTKMLNISWKPSTPFEIGIRETIKWFKENRWFWEGVHSP
jgi:dTDP-glucose 4,6-dehydratase